MGVGLFVSIFLQKGLFLQLKAIKRSSIGILQQLTLKAQNAVMSMLLTFDVNRDCLANLYYETSWEKGKKGKKQ